MTEKEGPFFEVNGMGQFVKDIDDVRVEIWNEGFYFIFDKVKLLDPNNKRNIEKDGVIITSNPDYRDPYLGYGDCEVGLLNKLSSDELSDKATDLYNKWKWVYTECNSISKKQLE